MTSSKKSTLKPFRKKFYSVSSFIIIAIAIIATVLVLINNQPNKSLTTNKKKPISLNLPSVPKIAPVPIKNIGSKDPDIKARRVALFDVASGSLLYGKDQDERVPIASVTKIMTATIVAQNYDLSDVITVSKESANSIGSVAGLKEGEKITTLSLLNCLLIPSGNDAAYTLAEHYGEIIKPGSTREEAIAAFVDKMNDKAKELGMINTHYLDPAGLNDDAKSTARDQGHLIAYALKINTIATIVHKPQATISSVDGSITHNLDSSDRLVKEEMYYPGVIGGKTGFTPLAGHNLLTEAVRDDHAIVAVILSTYSLAPNASAIEVRNLLNWGFDNYTWTNLY
jgi:D-alanyl-D-alanine carboxypeptidase